MAATDAAPGRPLRFAAGLLDTVAMEVNHSVHKALHWARRAFEAGATHVFFHEGLTADYTPDPMAYGRPLHEIGKLRCAGGRWAVAAGMTAESVAVPPGARCACATVHRDGRRASTTQRFRCRACRRTFTARTGTPFAGHRWPPEVITTAVRWSCRYRLSAADVRDLLAERRIDGAARAVLAWVHTFGPRLAAEGRRHAQPVGTRWWADETSVRVAGRWAYLSRAVAEHGQVVDVLLRAQRDLASARRGGRPRVVLTDKHPADRRAGRRRPGRATHVRTGPQRARGDTTKAIERSHVPVKARLRPRRGLQSVATGQCLPEGIELAHAVRRGHLRPDPSPGGPSTGRRPHARAREAVVRFTWLANRLLRAA